MRKVYLIAVFCLNFYYAFTQVTLPHHDPLDYIATQALQTQTGWTVLNSGDDLLISSGSLTFAGLQTSTGNKVTFDAAGIDAAKLFTQQTTGKVYYSFLVNVTALGSLGTTGGYFTGLNEGTGTNFGATVWTRSDGAGYDIGINPRTTAANTVWSSGTTSLNTTLFIVISYEIVGGATNDIVNMWINPTPGSSEPVPTLTATNSLTDLANLNRILIRQDGTTTTPFIQMDELRIGTTWSSVTPAGAACSGAPSGQASFGAITPSSNSASISLTAGTGGTGRVVKMNTVNSFTDLADGDNPAANTVYGGGEQVIYNGTGTGPINVTGLTTSTTYYLAIYEYNCASGRFYLLPPTTTNFSTLAAPAIGLQILSSNTSYTIDFDNTLANVNNGQFTGAGFTTSPSSGQLNSNAWEVRGWSDGNLLFGGSNASGDFARGFSSVSVTTGGTYAFEILSSNNALGFQPGSGDWAPGSVTLKMQNQTGGTLSSLTVAYKFYVRNDQGRASSFNFSHSADNSSFTSVSTFDYASPTTLEGTNWKAQYRVIQISGLSIADEDFYYVKWSSDDIGGSGSRDEFALDEIVIIGDPTSVFPTVSGNFETGVINSNVDLAGNTNFTQSLNLITGLIKLAANNLTVLDITGGDNSSYVQTNSTGTLTVQNIGTVLKWIPVGNSTYNPLTIINGSNANWSVRVEDAVNGVIAPFSNQGAVNRTWYITPTGVLGVAPDVTYYFNDAQASQLVNPAVYNASPPTVRFWHREAGNWSAISGDVALATPNGSQALLLSNYYYYGAVAISKSDAPLPVKFTNIRAYSVNAGIQVEWTNLTESDVVHYSVERSANGRDFISLGTAAPTRNDGGEAIYGWLDASPLPGVNFYRIQSLENDGKRLNSSIVRVDLRGMTEVHLYPNPLRGTELTLQAELKRGSYPIRVLNAAGQQVFSRWLIHNGGLITEVLELPVLKSGTYYLLVGETVKTFVVQ